MLYPKLIAFSTFQAFLISFLLSYYKIEIPFPELHFLKNPHGEAEINDEDAVIAADTFKPSSKISSKNVPSSSKGQQKRKSSSSSAEKNDRTKKSTDDTNVARLFTSKELAKFNGEGDQGLYLALLGRVYDVEKGRKHYGPGGGYHFFAGRDASRAFVTGDFKDTGLTDDVSGLSHQDMIGIQDWLSFYEKEYGLVGYLQGTYYDSRKQPTNKLKEVKKALEAAQQWQHSQKAESERFPACNSEWSQNKGGRVWCSNRSGGITRDWVGVPRKLFKPGNGQSRCACVKNFGPPQSDDVPASAQANRGDLDHPNMQEYPGCDPTAVSCNLTDS